MTVDGSPPALPGQQAEPELSQWQHLHPLSPVLRGGLVLLAVLGYAASQAFDSITRSLGGVLVPGSDLEGGRGEDLGLILAHPFIAAGALLAIMAVPALFSWLSWRFSKFRVAQRQVELRTGWLFRQHRQVPLERVQAVELGRPLLARLFGLAEVIVQSAGGKDSHLTLAFLSLPRATRFRDELLLLAGRTDERPVTAAGEDPAYGAVSPVPVAANEGEVILRVPNRRLFVATILHPATLVLGVIALSVVFGAAFGRFGFIAGLGLPALLPIVIGAGSGRIRELLKHGNFSLADGHGSLRITHGLTDLRATTVPLHRVQAAEMLQPVWWRPSGWWRIRVNVAGAALVEEDGPAESVVLPVGTRADVDLVMSLLAPGLDPALLASGLEGAGTVGGWSLVSPRSRLLDPWSWRRNGYAVLPDVVLLRTGRWRRSLTVIPYARVQSLRLTQGPGERRLGLAAIQLVSTLGPVNTTLDHLDLADAERLLGELARRAGQARARASGPRRHPSPGVEPSPPLAPGPAI